MRVPQTDQPVATATLAEPADPHSVVVAELAEPDEPVVQVVPDYQAALPDLAAGPKWQGTICRLRSSVLCRWPTTAVRF